VTSGFGRVVGVAGSSMLAAALGSTSCVFTEIGDCYPGLQLGDRVEIELVDQYLEGGPYLWSSAGEVGGVGSCERRDGLGAGERLPFIVDGRNGGFECWSYGVLPLRPVWDLDFSEVRIGAGAFLNVQVAVESGYWQLVVLRDARRESDPFGEEAVPGQLPPVVVRRTISDLSTMACSDAWVAEIRRLGPPSADAGTAERSP